MSRHINHLDVQDKVTHQFNTTSKRSNIDNNELSLAEQVALYEERKKQAKPEEKKYKGHRFAGWVTVSIIKKKR